MTIKRLGTIRQFIYAQLEDWNGWLDETSAMIAKNHSYGELDESVLDVSIDVLHFLGDHIRVQGWKAIWKTLLANKSQLKSKSIVVTTIWIVESDNQIKLGPFSELSEAQKAAEEKFGFILWKQADKSKLIDKTVEYFGVVDGTVSTRLRVRKITQELK